LIRSASPDRGGVLLRLLFLGALLAAGAAAWHAWRQGRLKLPARAAARPSPPTVRPEKVARLQSEVRGLLAHAGLREDHVLKAFTRERVEADARWTEENLELRAPPGFEPDAFRRRLTALLREYGLESPRETRSDGVWRLEAGAGDRVYVRLEFRWGAAERTALRRSGIIQKRGIHV
jgi:hypothetical protein